MNADLFWAKVDRRGPDECWPWTAYVSATGYGRFQVDGRYNEHKQAHRIAYELLIGPVPDGLQLHHECGNPACCNPAHLRPVTAAEHRELHRATHCRRGHEFTAENTLVTKQGWRVCRQCRRRTHKVQ